MTDNDIVKALECCMGCCCKECPYCDDGAEDCIGKLLVEALKLINRQKREIERLKEQNSRLNKECDHYIDFASTAKSEAIKEFAERLKESQIKCYLPLLGLSSRTEIEDYFNEILMQVRDAIENLVKEMTEETKHD